MQVAVPFPRFPALVALALVVLFLRAGAAEAAGLGKAKVVSKPGDLLKVRIELIQGPGDRISKIKAAVASPAIPENDENNQLWVTVDPAPYGRAVLTVRSIAPIDASKLELFVAVRSPAGRAYRSYDLDLPKPKRDAETASAGRLGAQSAAPGGNLPGIARVSPSRAAIAKTSAERAGPASAADPPAPADAKADDAAEVLADLEDQTSFGRLTALVALGIALLAAFGASWVWLYRRG